MVVVRRPEKEAGISLLQVLSQESLGQAVTGSVALGAARSGTKTFEVQSPNSPWPPVFRIAVHGKGPQWATASGRSILQDAVPTSKAPPQ